MLCTSILNVHIHLTLFDRRLVLRFLNYIFVKEIMKIEKQELIYPKTSCINVGEIVKKMSCINWIYFFLT